MDEKTEKAVPPGIGREEDFMYVFSTLPREEALITLAALQQSLVDLGNANNNSAKITICAFLDHAWQGERDWLREIRNVSEPHLKKMRRRKLKTDVISEPWHIDVLYGAFFGSGDPDYLKPVLRLADSGWNTVVAEAARWSLGSLRGRFPHVEAALTGGTA